MSLVSINKKREVSTPPQQKVGRAFTITVIDKFFLLGALAGSFSSICIGIYLWLQLSGLVAISAVYQTLRSLHAFMQFYLFLVPFILGFFIQSTPKIFEARVPIRPSLKVLIPLSFLAGIPFLLTPASLIGRAFLAAACWMTAVGMLPAILETTRAVKVRVGLPSLLGLLCLGAGTLVELTPVRALILFWGGVAPIIFATAQQFIAGVLGGSRPSLPAASTNFFLYLAALFCLYLSHELERVPAILSSGICLGTVLLYLRSVLFWRTYRRWFEPLGAAFLFAHIWAIIACVVLGTGAIYSDSVLHLFATGYAVTLIIGVSLRVIAWVTDTPAVNDKLLLVMLVGWQFVPLSRGLQPFLNLPSSWVLFSSVAGSLVLLLWATLVISRAMKSIRSQLVSTRRLLQKA